MTTKEQGARLTTAEREAGLVAFACPEHGFVAVAPARADVRCPCGRRAVRPRARGKSRA